MKTMFGLSLLPVVCRRACVVFTFIYVCLCSVVSNTYCVVLCFCFVCLRLVFPLLPISLDCPVMIAP